MKRVWKPLDIEGQRLYQVEVRFWKNPKWNMTKIVAGKSPSYAAELVKASYAGTVWIEEPDITGKALNVLQPVEWRE